MPAAKAAALAASSPASQAPALAEREEPSAGAFDAADEAGDDTSDPNGKRARRRHAAKPRHNDDLSDENFVPKKKSKKAKKEKDSHKPRKSCAALCSLEKSPVAHAVSLSAGLTAHELVYRSDSILTDVDLKVRSLLACGAYS